MTLYADTGYWIDLLDQREELHLKAKQCESEFRRRKIVTSDVVVAELLNCFSKEGEHLRRMAAAFARALYNNSNVEVIPAKRAQFIEAIDLYEKRLDKEYSHVDCVSFAIMKVKNLKEALAHDKHFEQEGYVALLRR